MINRIQYLLRIFPYFQFFYTKTGILGFKITLIQQIPLIIFEFQA